MSGVPNSTSAYDRARWAEEETVYGGTNPLSGPGSLQQYQNDRDTMIPESGRSQAASEYGQSGAASGRSGVSHASRPSRSLMRSEARSEAPDNVSQLSGYLSTGTRSVRTAQQSRRSGASAVSGASYQHSDRSVSTAQQSRRSGGASAVSGASHGQSDLPVSIAQQSRRSGGASAVSSASDQQSNLRSRNPSRVNDSDHGSQLPAPPSSRSATASQPSGYGSHQGSQFPASPSNRSTAASQRSGNGPRYIDPPVVDYPHPRGIERYTGLPPLMPGADPRGQIVGYEIRRRPTFLERLTRREPEGKIYLL
jgi:hypothetical protein